MLFVYLLGLIGSFRVKDIRFISLCVVEERICIACIVLCNQRLGVVESDDPFIEQGIE